MALDKIKRVRLQAEVEKSVRSYIDENELQEGDKLPSERELCEQLGVGRSSLRESLRALEALGIVQVAAGKGIFVADSAGSRAAHEYFLHLIDEKVSALEVLEVRTRLEALAAELAARNATRDQVDRIRAALLKIEERYDNDQNGNKDDIEFHSSIYAASGNALLPHIGEVILGMWLEYLTRLQQYVLIGDDFAQTTPSHRPVYEAIRDGDPKAAVRAVDSSFEVTASIIIASQKRVANGSNLQS
jgi:GntR family transcriptional regulator, transcriptional repressor for pyruvate dehydrogenase complex